MIRLFNQTTSVLRGHTCTLALFAVFAVTTTVGVFNTIQAGVLDQVSHHAENATSAASIEEARAKLTTVDLNTATAAQLATVLKGVGATKAEAIVEYRTKVGTFRSVEELEQVKRIGRVLSRETKAELNLVRPRAKFAQR